MVKLHLLSPICIFIVILIIGNGCSHKSSPAAVWTPTQFPADNAQLIRISGVDKGVLADMVTSVLREGPNSPLNGIAYPIDITDIAVHPQHGPFFFQCGAAIISVADSEERILQGLETSVILRQTSKIYYIQLIDNASTNQVIISNQLKLIDITPAQNIASSPNSNSRGKIKLTPENMAEALAHFSQWEGVHLDTVKGELVFVGSQATEDNPQISASDLITAYKAIFEHEANGQALFVDMDFDEEKDDYLVTFGGGFEDTRPGRVLYSADLLLKTLSSGIDPWTNEKPLVEVMCESSRKNNFQLIFCDYIRPQLSISNRKYKSIIESSLANYLASREMADLIISLSTEADGDSGGAWAYVFFASQNKQREILNEIERKGYFTYVDAESNEYLEAINKIKALDPAQRELFINQFGKKNWLKILEESKYTLSNACACVPYYGELNNCEKDCNKEATYRRVKAINDLTADQKSIVLEARKFSNESDRRLYATLSFCSPKIHYFLRTASLSEKKQLFLIMKRLEGIGLTNNYESLIANIAMLYFMSEKSGFLKKFLALSEEDQLVTGYITSRMMLSPSFSQMINQLQFHQPLCCKTCKVPRGVNSYKDAYLRFVCKYLREYSRTYLADLIRNEVGDRFDYKTSAEINKEETNSGNSDKIIQVRYWFFPGNEVLTLAAPSALNTFLFNKPNMEARAERLGERRGPYETVDFDYDLPGVQENLSIVNKHYDDLSQLFPELKELNNLVRMLAFFRWVHYYHSEKFDLEAFSEVNDFGTPTPRTYPVYETVTALPDGSLLRAVGGVDLHSNTQVGFNHIKVNDFLASLVSVPNGNTFTFSEKNFTTARPIKKSFGDGIKKEQTIEHENKKLELVEDRGFYTLIYFQDNKIRWSLSNQVDPMDRKISVLSNYSDTGVHRNIWMPIGMQEGWHIKNQGDSIVATGLYDTSNILKEGEMRNQLRKSIADLCSLNVPFEVLWAYMSAIFDNARLTEKNREFLFSFRMGGKTYCWAGKPNQQRQYIIEDVNELSLQKFLDAPIVLTQPQNKNTQIIGVQLKSIVPTDSLILNELGYRNDTLIRVNIWDDRLIESNIFEWRKQTTPGYISEFPWGSKAKNQTLLSPVVKEEKKGDFITYELTNRAFLVEAIANLRAKYINQKKYFALSLKPPFASNLADFTNIWVAPRHRHYIIDLAGFSPSLANRLLEFAKKSPGNIYIYNQNKIGHQIRNADEVTGSSFIPSHKPPVPPEPADEIIWVSTLTEREIRCNLESPSLNYWLKGAKRLRVFNVNNPVYDLGDNLFIEHPGLQVIGAWTHIVDFDAMLILLESLALSPDSKELDLEIMQKTKEIQDEFRKRPSPIRLRFSRDLNEVLYSWEQIRHFFNDSEIEWKQFTK